MTNKQIILLEIKILLEKAKSNSLITTAIRLKEISDKAWEIAEEDYQSAIRIDS